MHLWGQHPHKATTVNLFHQTAIEAKWLAKSSLTGGRSLPSMVVSCKLCRVYGFPFIEHPPNRGLCCAFCLCNLRACYFACKADLKARKYTHNFRRYYLCAQLLLTSNNCFPWSVGAHRVSCFSANRDCYKAEAL